MVHSNRQRRTRQIETLRTQFAQADGLPFAEVFSAERIETALREEKATWREEVYTPALTLWAFLGQMVCPDGSCRAAVARVLAWLVSRGERPCTPQTGPYCKARQRLPESLLQRLARETGRGLHDETAPWLWKGRRVKVVDGTTVSMPDTEANQAAYPQHTAQRPGLGFPIARLVVVFCLSCGTALDAALGRYQGKRTGETALLRRLDDALEPGDVLLGDRYYGGWFDLALLQERGIDAVVRLHQHRTCDFRRGRRLGPGDHIVEWIKPTQRPEWMDAATYARLPPRLVLRELRVHVTQAGFRTDHLVVVTTLIDPAVTAEDLAELYRARWHVEVNQPQCPSSRRLYQLVA